MTIEKEIIAYLIGENLDGIGSRVFGETPEDDGDDYILVEKTGSGLTNHIESATIAVQSYGSSMSRASDMNKDVKVAMISMPETEDVYSVNLVSDYNYTNPATKRPRYQAVFTIYY